VQVDPALRLSYEDKALKIAAGLSSLPLNFSAWPLIQDKDRLLEEISP